MAIRFWEIYEETKEKYKLRILAGKNGMDNVTGWVHMLEDETIINRFSGEELAVTTGMKAGNEGWLLRLVSSMKNAESTGIIINTGMYLKQIPEEVIDWCEAHDFPLLEMPWEISITDLIQDYCMRIMSQMHKERQEALLFERLLRGKEVPEDFLEDIGNRYNLDGTSGFSASCPNIPRKKSPVPSVRAEAGKRIRPVAERKQNQIPLLFNRSERFIYSCHK